MKSGKKNTNPTPTKVQARQHPDPSQMGFHVSISPSIDLAVDRALGMGCTSFQMFTRNPRGWAYKPLNDDHVTLFIDKRKKASYRSVVIHMPYLPNLAASERGYLKKSRASLSAELARCGRLGADYLVAHIGSHMGKGSVAGVRNVINALNESLEANSESETVLLIETMAGQKNSVGSRFEELKMILDGIARHPEKVGVCIDTCHLFAAGFDISSQAGVESAMGLFDEIVGYERLKVIHLNDSGGPLGSALDRHEHLGMGRIGEPGLRAFLRYRRNPGLPIIMETPIDQRRDDAGNLSVAKRMLTG